MTEQTQYTVKQLSERLKVSKTSIQRYAAKLDPEKMHQTYANLRNGRQVTLIDSELAKRIEEWAAHIATDIGTGVAADAPVSHSPKMPEAGSPALTQAEQVATQVYETLIGQLAAKDRQIEALQATITAQQATITTLTAIIDRTTPQHQPPKEQHQSRIKALWRRIWEIEDD